MTAQVTAMGIRDGDPAVLHALVDRRGAAVLAYCERVCAPGLAAEAAADAFARFRAMVIGTARPSDLDPEAALLTVTRHAAAERAPAPAAGTAGPLGRLLGGKAADQIALVPGLLVARMDGTLDGASEDQLNRLLDASAAARAAEERFHAAEHAYRTASPRRISTPVVELIITTMGGVAPQPADALGNGAAVPAVPAQPVAAAPLRPEPRPPAPVTPEPVATTHQEEPEPDPVAASPQPEPSPPAQVTPEPVATTHQQEPEPEAPAASPAPDAVEAPPETVAASPQPDAAEAPVAEPETVAASPEPDAAEVPAVAEPEAVTASPERNAAEAPPVTEPEAVTASPERNAAETPPVAEPEAVAASPEPDTAEAPPVGEPETVAASPVDASPAAERETPAPPAPPEEAPDAPAPALAGATAMGDEPPAREQDPDATVEWTLPPEEEDVEIAAARIAPAEDDEASHLQSASGAVEEPFVEEADPQTADHIAAAAAQLHKPAKANPVKPRPAAPRPPVPPQPPQHQHPPHTAMPPQVPGQPAKLPRLPAERPHLPGRSALAPAAAVVTVAAIGALVASGIFGGDESSPPLDTGIVQPRAVNAIPEGEAESVITDLREAAASARRQRLADRQQTLATAETAEEVVPAPPPEEAQPEEEQQREEAPTETPDPDAGAAQPEAEEPDTTGGAGQQEQQQQQQDNPTGGEGSEVEGTVPDAETP